MRAVTPYAGPPVELDNGDSYRLVWEGFDLNTTGSPAVFAALVKVGSANPGNATMAIWAAAPYNATPLGDDIIWVLPTSTAGADPAGGEAGATAADGSVIINISDYATNASGTAWTEGDYELYYFLDPDEDGGVPDADWSTNPPNGVKAHGTVYLSAQTTTAYNVRLSPSKMSMSPGDTLEVDVYATDDGTAENPNMAIFFVEIPQASLFEIVDQDGDPDNGVVQPFDNLIGTTTVAPNELLGDVLMNSLETVGGSYVLGYLEKLASGSTNDVTDSKMTSFKFTMSSAIATPIEDLEIVFSESEGFETNLYDDDGSPQATSLPPVALTVRMGQSGILYGAVDVEGRDDQGEEVSFYLAEAGSFTPLADAAYLDANSDLDGTDGVQVTLGAAGYYELEGIPSGEYDVILRMDGYLDVVRTNQRIVSMDYTAMNFTGGNKLFGGDAAGFDDDGVAATASLPDNRIDGDDTDAIATAFGTSSGDSLWNEYADVDESGTVGINDLFMASKNLGRDGEGVFYREIPGSNEDAVIYLAVVDETAEGITFAVQAEKLGSLSAYSVDMFVPANDWEVVGHSDGLASHFKTIEASRLDGPMALFGSAAKGYASVVDKEAELMTFTLRQRSVDPEMPTLSGVTLVSSDGILTSALIGGMREMVPDEFALSQNYPNPFNPSTNINFSLPSEGQVKLTVFNLLGQEVRTLVSGALEPGNYKAVWNSLNNQGEKVGTGIYFYHLVVNNKVIATKKMVLMK
ncbi:MAG: T9SS type A sorting domain-containing protein [Fidelibacterota bacterium]|nr:MAG: T9SS type A sorting domain-containing protein [Candidatus Neomarinimicrobiota bacterium]